VLFLEETSSSSNGILILKNNSMNKTIISKQQSQKPISKKSTNIRSSIQKNKIKEMFSIV
jgi:hypothetical protein